MLLLLLLLLLMELLPNTIWKRQRAAVCAHVLKHDASGGKELRGGTFKRELLASHTTMRPSPSKATHAGGMSELLCAAALAADGAHASPVPVPQHLHRAKRGVGGGVMQAGAWPQEGSGWLPVILKNVPGRSVLRIAFDSSVALSPSQSRARGCSCIDAGGRSCGV
jgi:hypothetical protein